MDTMSDEPEKGHAFIADGQGGRPTPYYRALAAGLAGEAREGKAGQGTLQDRRRGQSSCRWFGRSSQRPMDKVSRFHNPKGAMMPTISMFYGILVSIFYGDIEQHHTPHIHVRYQGEKASVAIDDGRLLAGNFPPRQLRMVQVWIDIHRDELMADWELVVAGDEPFRIAPLR